MLYFPNFSKTSFSNNIKIIKQAFLYFDIFKKLLSLANLVGFFKYLTAGCGCLFGLLSLIRKLLSIFKFKFGLLLSVYHVIIAEFVIDAVNVEIGKVVLG
jgi:hypothetical protein